MVRQYSIFWHYIIIRRHKGVLWAFSILSLLDFIVLKTFLCHCRIKINFNFKAVKSNQDVTGIPIWMTSFVVSWLKSLIDVCHIFIRFIWIFGMQVWQCLAWLGIIIHLITFCLLSCHLTTQKLTKHKSQKNLLYAFIYIHLFTRKNLKLFVPIFE